jgi:CBS domain containing-hemolysin-like protein
MTALLLALVVLLILVNGFFVAAEFALVRSRRSRMEELSKQGSKRATRALHQMEHIDEYVAACQVGITLASIGIGFLGEPAIADLLEPLLGDVFGHGVSVALAFIIAYALITYSHVLAGEQAPKMMGIARAESVLLFISRPLDLFRSLFSPLIYATNAPARFFVARVLGWEISPESEAASSEELQVLISHSAVGGDLDPGEAGMLRGVFHLHEQEAREVMTPIPAVVAVDASAKVTDALEMCWTSGHNRLLVVEDGNPDRVRGIAHALRLTRLLMSEGPDVPIESAVRDALIVPETKALDDLLAELQRQRSSMGVVVDEYGRTVGIVTVEDILEEVVGEIEDETDPLAGAVRRLASGDWYVRGHVSLGDLLDIGIELPVDTDAYNSIGGYVFGELGRLPKRGDLITADGYEIRVESVRENRIEAVRIHPAESRPAPGAGREAGSASGEEDS